MDPIINHRRLDREAPHWRKLELDYRPHVNILASQINATLFSVAFMNLFGLGLTVFVLGTGDLAFLTVTLAMGVSLFQIVVVGVLIYTKGDWRAALRWGLLCLLLPPLVGALYWIINFGPALLLLHSLALVFAAYFADRFAKHFYYWLTATHRLLPAVREQRRQWFELRFSPFKLSQARRELREERKRLEQEGNRREASIVSNRIREATAIAGYRRGLLIAIAFYLLIPYLPYWLGPALLVLVVPPAFAWFRIVRLTPAGRRFTRMLSVLGHGAVSWFTYAQYTEDIPGVFASPAGRRGRRALLAMAVFALVAVTTIPAARYFPVAMDLARINPNNAWWQQFNASLDDNSSRVYNTLRWDDLPNTELRGAPLQQLEQLNSWKRRAYADFVSESRIAWVYIALDGLFRQPWFMVPLVMGAFCSLLFPTLCIASMILLAAGPVLITAYGSLYEVGPDSEQDDAVSDWEAYVQRLQASKTPYENHHLWLGHHPTEDFPVLLHRDILQEHSYIVGDSGSGKTALGVTPLVTQLIRQRHAAVVILDLKGDSSLFEAARAEATRSGAEFKFFTNELNRATHIFNPFGLADSQHISLNQLCEMFLEALSLNHGEGYGRSYYSRMARHWLAGALRKNPGLTSFEELYEYTRKKGAFQNAEEKERVFELISVIESLATFEQLNLTPRSVHENAQAAEHAIVMSEVIRDKQVVYFWLPAAVEAATVREIAKLALYSLMNSAYFFDRTDVLTPEDELLDKPSLKHQTYLVIDEFQRIASGNFKIILEQARSMGIGAILANQTFADLVTPESDLRPTIESNTRLKLCFSATDLEQQDRIIKASGETKDWEFGYSDSPKGRTFTFTQKIFPRIRRNNVIEIGDDPFLAVCQIVRGSGYSQYSGYSIPLQTSYAVSRQEYQRRLLARWPEKSEKTIVVSRAPLPERPFATVEQRLDAAQEAYKESENAVPKQKTEEPASAKSASGAQSLPPWAERLEKLRDSLCPKPDASA